MRRLMAIFPSPAECPLGTLQPVTCKFDPSVNSATASCNTESCNSVVTPSVKGFPRWNILEDSQDGRSTSPNIYRGVFLKNGGGVKLPKLTLVLWWSTMVTKMVDHIFENGRPVSDFCF